MLTIGPGDDADLASYAEFWYAMLDECGLLGSGTVPDWRERLRVHFASLRRAGRMQWFVAHDGKRLAGTAAATLSGGEGDIFLDRRAWLAGIYIAPRYRRRGIARALTQAAIDWCREQGCASIGLRASDAGRPLYESLGFAPVSEMELRLR